MRRPGPGKGPLAAALGLALVACAARNLAAADVILLKGNDVAAWRPALDAIRRAASTQTLTEFDLRGLKEEATQVLDGLKAKAGDAIFVAVGPLAASAVREAFPQSRVVFCMVQDPQGPGTAGCAGSDRRRVRGAPQESACRLPDGEPRGRQDRRRLQTRHARCLHPGGHRSGRFGSPCLGAEADRTEKDVPNALRSLLSGGEAADALWLVPDAIMLGDDTRRFVMSETLKAGRPVYAFSAALIPEGALVSDGPDIASIGEQVGDLVKRLAAGEKGRIDMLMPRSDLVINKKIAGKLKVEIPGDALRAAAGSTRMSAYSWLGGSIRTRLLLLVTVAALMVGGSATIFGYLRAQKILGEEMAKRGRYVATNLAYNSNYGVLTEDKPQLNELLTGALSAANSNATDDIAGAMVRDAKGAILAQRGVGVRDLPPTPAAQPTESGRSRTGGARASLPRSRHWPRRAAPSPPSRSG